ncbi:MAG: hypothetical protein ACXWKP_27275, partial [Bradyrhizobium sp.]
MRGVDHGLRQKNLSDQAVDRFLESGWGTGTLIYIGVGSRDEIDKIAHATFSSGRWRRWA